MEEEDRRQIGVKSIPNGDDPRKLVSSFLSVRHYLTFFVRTKWKKVQIDDEKETSLRK